ncbi:MAG TPA: GNAT family N-acetyltransferase [Mycobacteriales bacterium]|nr:GNAT family N-acetyltransferase [Mycobacteriales bacterium]
MIRRITTGDVEVFRQTRLRALADSPASFGSTYDAEVARRATWWSERVAAASDGDEQAMFLAFDGDECIGLAGGFTDDLGADRQLISMWVAPEYRGSGVATELVDAVLGWAVDGGARTVGLWVTEGNGRARRLYERLGFVVTGEVQPLPSDPSKDEIRMVYRATAKPDDPRVQLRERLAAAMKQRDSVAVRVLRTTIAAIDNAEAPAVDPAELGGMAIERSPRGAGAGEVPRTQLTATEMRALVRREIDDRLQTAAEYELAGRAEHAERLRAEAAVLGDLGASASRL